MRPTPASFSDHKTGILNDEDNAISLREDYLPNTVLAVEPRIPNNSLVDYLKCRYVTSSSLSKWKADEPIQAASMLPSPSFLSAEQPVHPATKMCLPLKVLALASAQLLHPMTKMCICRPEQPFHIPESKRLILGSKWINTPPPNVLFEKAKWPRPWKSEVRCTKLKQWLKWAKKKEKEHQINTNYAPGQWVQIRRGVYRGDPGQVFKLQMQERSDEEIEKERKLVKEGVQIPKQDRSVAGYELNGQILSHGLLLKLYKPDGLKPMSMVDVLTVVAFEEHPFSKRFPFPLPDNWEFCNGEEVEVSSREGHEHGQGVLGLSGGELCIEFVHDRVVALFPVTKERLKKVIKIGNYVEVISGDMVC
ncbi:hypothetical protein V5O48_016326 [Marasmius crinis-equi]|uniref:Uncharacterized protein n=1 Tax=Marasmius crinis-equi TaxID=585013 RepID=A0ABR3ES74_9AGAR